MDASVLVRTRALRGLPSRLGPRSAVHFTVQATLAGEEVSTHPSTWGPKHTARAGDAVWNGGAGVAQWTLSEAAAKTALRQAPKVVLHVIAAPAGGGAPSLLGFAQLDLRDLRAAALKPTWLKLRGDAAPAEVLVSARLQYVEAAAAAAAAPPAKEPVADFEAGVAAAAPPAAASSSRPVGPSGGGTEFELTVELSSAAALASLAPELALAKAAGRGYWFSYQLFDMVLQSNRFESLDAPSLEKASDTFSLRSCVPDLAAELAAKSPLPVYLCSEGIVVGATMLDLSALVAGVASPDDAAFDATSFGPVALGIAPARPPPAGAPDPDATLTVTATLRRTSAAVPPALEPPPASPWTARTSITTDGGASASLASATASASASVRASAEPGPAAAAAPPSPAAAAPSSPSPSRSPRPPASPARAAAASPAATDDYGDEGFEDDAASVPASPATAPTLASSAASPPRPPPTVASRVADIEGPKPAGSPQHVARRAPPPAPEASPAAPAPAPAPAPPRPPAALRLSSASVSSAHHAAPDPPPPPALAARSLKELQAKFERWRAGEEAAFERKLREKEALKMRALEREAEAREAATEAAAAAAAAEYGRLEGRLRKALADVEGRERRLAAAEASLKQTQQQKLLELQLLQRKLRDEGKRAAEHEKGRADDLHARLGRSEEGLARAEGRARDAEADFEKFRAAQRQRPDGGMATELAKLRADAAEQSARADRERAEKGKALLEREQFRGQVHKLARALQRERDKQAAGARRQLEQLRLEYRAREERFVLDGDRSELKNIKHELASLRGLGLDDGAAAPGAGPAHVAFNKPAGGGGQQRTPQRKPAAAAGPPPVSPEVSRLLRERDELLAGGLYGAGDAVVLAIGEKIREASVARQ